LAATIKTKRNEVLRSIKKKREKKGTEAIFIAEIAAEFDRRLARGCCFLVTGAQRWGVGQAFAPRQLLY